MTRIDDDDSDVWEDEDTAGVDFLADRRLAGRSSCPTLLVMSGSRLGDRIEVVDGLLIGRGERATCKIADSGISRIHVRFDQQPDGSFTVVDLGSRNGTRVNGKKMQSAVLNDGDSILIGTSTVLNYEGVGALETAQDPSDDRRAHRRVGVVVKVEYPSVEDFLEDYSINISRGGMRICTTLRLEVGDELQMRLSLPGLMEPVQVRGTVRWVRQDDGSSESTAGVKIDAADEESRAALDALVARLIGGPEEAEPSQRKIRLLVADDNPVVIELIHAGLERQLRRQPRPLELETAHAQDGPGALKLLSQGRYDLLIVEAGLPLIDGETLIRTIRSDPRFAEMLIAATSRDGEQFRTQLLQAGADFFISKPLRLVDLLQTVRGFLADSSGS